MSRLARTKEMETENLIASHHSMITLLHIELASVPDRSRKSAAVSVDKKNAATMPLYLS